MFRRKNVELLSNFDIIEICKIMNINLIGCFNKDLLEDITPEVGCYVINLEDSGSNGTHWCGIILQENYVSYFDSFGVRPSDDVRYFISRYVRKSEMETIYSLQQIQNIASVLCGYYVIYFFYFHTVLHSEITDNKKLMSKHNRIYNSIYDLWMNDSIIQKLIKNILI